MHIHSVYFWCYPSISQTYVQVVIRTIGVHKFVGHVRMCWSSNCSTFDSICVCVWCLDETRSFINLTQILFFSTVTKYYTEKVLIYTIILEKC